MVMMLALTLRSITPRLRRTMRGCTNLKLCRNTIRKMKMMMLHSSFQPVDCNYEAKKFCKTCFLFKEPELVWRSHHTGQMLACPTILIEVKRKLVEESKRGHGGESGVTLMP